jgi:preprotein translocase subunit SecE
LATKSRAEGNGLLGGVTQYLRETWFELKKVSWPTRSEATNLTIIVVSVTTFLALVLGVLDWLFQTAFGLLL